MTYAFVNIILRPLICFRARGIKRAANAILHLNYTSLVNIVSSAVAMYVLPLYLLLCFPICLHANVTGIPVGYIISSTV